MHRMLLKSATQEEGEGTPAKLEVDHKATEVDCVAGTVTFENGTTITADLIIGADGVSVGPPLQSDSSRMPSHTPADHSIFAF